MSLNAFVVVVYGFMGLVVFHGLVCSTIAVIWQQLGMKPDLMELLLWYFECKLAIFVVPPKRSVASVHKQF